MSNQSVATRTVDSTINKIKQRQARVGIIGLGYVGLPLALLFSEQKFVVTGFDIDQRKVDSLAKGESYIYRIGADEIQALLEWALRHKPRSLRAARRRYRDFCKRELARLERAA